VHAFLTSALLVALAEIGDKTQLLSFVLAARLGKPWAITAGILVATLANHLLASSLGVWAAGLIRPQLLPWLTGFLFVGFGLWTLHPDSLDDDPRLHRAGAFVTATIAFFLAEMGDKTQLATVALAARFETLIPVVFGTTVGMLLANIPAVFLGKALAQKLPMTAIRIAAAVVFVATGVLSVLGAPSIAQ
jgi:putative Ca2+/H+ antiporter (TMEM165/GDT1 family)